MEAVSKGMDVRQRYPKLWFTWGKHTPSCRDFRVCVNWNMASFEIVCYEFLNLSDHLVGFPAVAAGSYAEP